MNSFLRKIEHLKEMLGVMTLPPVTLIYMDGRKRTMNDDEALNELFTRNDIKEVHCDFAALKSLLDALLPGCDCGASWDDDSDMLNIQEDENEAY